MTKRFVCLFLSVILCFGILPLGASAASAGASVGSPIFEDYELPLIAGGDEDLCTVCVYLDVNDTEYTYGVEIERGECYTPAEPARVGESFCGWYTDRYLTKPYNSTVPITQDVDLFARWVKDEDMCSVYVYLDAADAEYIFGAEVPRGDVYGAPEAPGRENEYFGGWYTDRALTKPYDPHAPIEEDTCLFPRWDKEEDLCSVYIYLRATDSEPLVGVDIPRGSIFGAPEPPGADGLFFAGWYTDRALTKPYDPAAPITEDTSLFPRFEEIGTVYMLGDADADGAVTSIDAAVIRRHIAKIYTPTFLEIAADADGDGEITVIDATMIQRWLASLPSNNRIGKLIRIR